MIPNKVDPYIRTDISEGWLVFRHGIPLPVNGICFENVFRRLKVTVNYNEANEHQPATVHVSCSKRDGSEISDEEVYWLLHELIAGSGDFYEILCAPEARQKAKEMAERLKGHPITMPIVRHFVRPL
jgi:hypothetical protein